MKNLFTLLVLITTTVVFAQEKFDLNPESPNFSSNHVIINIDGLSVAEEFKIVDTWIKMTFDSPFEVIKCKVENEFIKISNTVDNLYFKNHLFSKNYYDVNYDILFCFKNNKVKFEIVKIKVHYPKTINSGGWEEISFNDNDHFKSNGEIKPDTKESFKAIENYFNNLVTNLKRHLENPNLITFQDNW